MSNLSQLHPKPQIKELDGVEIKIVPLTVDRLEAFQKDSLDPKPEEELKLLREIIKDSIPTATDEEIGKLDTINLKKIQELILEVNGMDKGQDQTSRMKDVIAARQTQAKSQGQ